MDIINWIELIISYDFTQTNMFSSFSLFTGRIEFSYSNTVSDDFENIPTWLSYSLTFSLTYVKRRSVSLFLFTK